MPLYEYKCTECNAKYEHLTRSLEDKSIPECPVCHSKNVVKLISAFAMAGGGDGYQESSCESGGGHCCGGSCSAH